MGRKNDCTNERKIVPDIVMLVTSLTSGRVEILTKTFQLGAVGYVYNQITADRGCLQALCPFESRTASVGPQVGFLFPNAAFTTYLNLKAYWDFDAQNRASGASVWVTLAFSPTPPTHESASSSIVAKAAPHQ